MPKCEVVDPAFSWGDDRRPRTPWHDTVIYEVHVQRLHEAPPRGAPQTRGTYAGLGTTPVIEHLQRLGVTAVELLPVHCFVDDRHLVEKGLTNYWGYNSLGFFAPSRAMRPSLPRQDREFKTMVKALHRAGIEVILDVVYNHTAEGNHLGPTLSLPRHRQRRVLPPGADDPRYYMDYTGCGNTLNMRHPRVLQLIMDSLRYWVLEMHVDGFRFDLAAALARELHDVDRLGAFFDIIHQDPVISQVKLIAEPWDLGEGGYQVGNFPVGWAEWNGRYRDAIRRFWKGDGGQIGELAYRLAGSSDLYEHERPPPVREHQLRHRARRLHAARSRQLQRQAQRSERRRQPRRRRTTTAAGTAASRARPTTRRSRAARSARSATCSRRCCSRKACRCSRRRRVRPHAAWQQQRLLPGQRADAGSTGSSTRKTASCSSSRAA